MLGCVETPTPLYYGVIDREHIKITTVNICCICQQHPFCLCTSVDKHLICAVWWNVQLSLPRDNLWVVLMQDSATDHRSKDIHLEIPSQVYRQCSVIFCTHAQGQKQQNLGLMPSPFTSCAALKLKTEAAGSSFLSDGIRWAVSPAPGPLCPSRLNMLQICLEKQRLVPNMLLFSSDVCTRIENGSLMWRKNNSCMPF